MIPSHNKRKIKNYITVNKNQFKLTLSNLGFSVLTIVVIIITVLSPFYYDIYRGNDVYFHNYSAKIFLTLLERLSYALITILLLAILYQILQVVFTHKFYGPMVNFSKTFDRISQGDLTRKVVIRRHDFLKNEARQINEMMDALSNRITKIKTANDLLLSGLEQVGNSDIEKGKSGHALNMVKKQAHLCHEYLSKFKIHANNNQKQFHTSTGQTHLNPNTRRTNHDGVSPFPTD
ncbi:MAG: methyl-accepting chemotaxis protein [Desulfobacterales bacterium]|jgi:methyl-accepting chemotaxis protein